MRIALIALALIAHSGVVYASPNDLRLNARRNGQGILFDQRVNGTFGSNKAAWEDLAGELAFVFAPRVATPAETLGHAGFQTAILWSGTFVASDQPYWFVTEEAQTKGQPKSMLSTLQVDLRKGLPWSFEIGANVIWLMESEMLAPGLELRWTPIEGYRTLPDFSVRASANTVIGNRDMNLTVIGVDGTLSKSFGIGDTMNIAPYLSYGILMVAANTRVIDPTPDIEEDLGQDIVFPQVTAGSNVHQRWIIGSRFLFSVINISVQGEFEFLRKMASGTRAFGPVAGITTKLGLDF